MSYFCCDMTSLTWLRLREPIHHNPKKPPHLAKKAEKTNYHHNMDTIYQNSSTEPTPEGLHGTA